MNVPINLGDRILWERLISESPDLDAGILLLFMVAKHDLTLIRFSGEVQIEEVGIQLWINGELKVSLDIDEEANKNNFYGTVVIEQDVEAGQLVEIYIDDPGSTSLVAANLTIELQGYETTDSA